ncbi:MAG: cupin domain-containing protein [Novosphingobium sp.]|nr:cupin domain-containing protein [Novosphingobium sp.]
MNLSTFDPAAFLREHWQKKPALIRNPWTSWNNPLDPNSLAGLACEDGVESRLVMEAGTSWAVEHGPFAEDRFATLGERGWTLLVQAVDHWVPEVAELRGLFRFIPDWRIDDVMVSYAADGGGVGPHFDGYDVFLIQGLGRRRWQIGARCDSSTPLLAHDELRLLADFEPEQEWVLEPGDILYVPPGVAHNGVAVGGDCMTYSIGFRAPSAADLISGWSGYVLERIDDDIRYADPDLRSQPNPGEICAETIERLQAMMASQLLDREAFARWFGEYSTSSKYGEIDFRREVPLDLEQLHELAATDVPLRRDPASRFSFVELAEGVILFVNGHSIECGADTAELARQLCAQESFIIDPAVANRQAAAELLLKLVNGGSLDFDQAD